MRTRITLFALLASTCGLVACSRTTPIPTMPPLPPSGGLLYAPFPDPEDDDGKKDDDDADDDAPKAPTGPAAIKGDLPATFDVKLEPHFECTADFCALVGWLPDAALAKVDGKDSPGALWQHDIAAGHTLNVPRHAGLDYVVFVLKGNVSVKGDEGGTPQKLAPLAVLRAPGAGIALHADDAASLIVAVVAAEGTLGSALEMAKKTPAKAKWAKRAGALEVKQLADVADLVWGKGVFHARIAFGGEKERESFELMMGAAGAAISEHDHPTSWEHLAVLQGDGMMQLAGKPVEVKAGSTLHIPLATRHSLQIGPAATLIAAQIYSPAGPEQRFVKLAEDDKKK